MALANTKRYLELIIIMLLGPISSLALSQETATVAKTMGNQIQPGLYKLEPFNPSEASQIGGQTIMVIGENVSYQLPGPTQGAFPKAQIPGGAASGFLVNQITILEGCRIRDQYKEWGEGFLEMLPETTRVQEQGRLEWLRSHFKLNETLDSAFPDCVKETAVWMTLHSIKDEIQ